MNRLHDDCVRKAKIGVFDVVDAEMLGARDRVKVPPLRGKIAVLGVDERTQLAGRKAANELGAIGRTSSARRWHSLPRTGTVTYAIEEGMAFAELAPSVGDSEWSLSSTQGSRSFQQASRCFRLVRTVIPQIYSRISEVRPTRRARSRFSTASWGAFVYARTAIFPPKWRDLYASRAPSISASTTSNTPILRFAGRIVVKPVHPAALQPVAPKPTILTAITN